LGVLLVWLRDNCDLVQTGPGAAPATGSVVGGRFLTSELELTVPSVPELLVGLLVCGEDPDVDEDPEADV
jgi:hypothetical protein